MNSLIVAGKRWLLPFLFYGLIWFILSKGNFSSWIVGLPSIAFAVIATDRLFAPGKEKVRISALPGFVIWFLWHSLRGGLDVAWRALQPRVQLKPGFLRYPMALPPGRARVFMVNVISLLPGTLSADIEGDVLVLHALDTSADVIVETREAETRISALYSSDRATPHG